MLDGPKRLIPPAIPLDEIPKIDVVTVSHNHYDHLDVRAVRNFQHKSAKVITPLNLAKYLNEDFHSYDTLLAENYYKVNIFDKEIDTCLRTKSWF